MRRETKRDRERERKREGGEGEKGLYKRTYNYNSGTNQAQIPGLCMGVKILNRVVHSHKGTLVTYKEHSDLMCTYKTLSSSESKRRLIYRLVRNVKRRSNVPGRLTSHPFYSW